MPCLNSDGTLVPTAQSVMHTVQKYGTAEEIFKHIQLPLYRVRSSLRELTELGFINEEDGKYVITAEGRKRLEQGHPMYNINQRIV